MAGGCKGFVEPREGEESGAGASSSSESGGKAGTKCRRRTRCGSGVTEYGGSAENVSGAAIPANPATSAATPAARGCTEDHATTAHAEFIAQCAFDESRCFAPHAPAAAATAPTTAGIPDESDQSDQFEWERAECDVYG